MTPDLSTKRPPNRSKMRSHIGDDGVRNERIGKIARAIDQLGKALDQAMSDIAGSNEVALNGLDHNIALLCDHVSRLEKHEGKEFIGALSGLIRRLDALTASYVSVRQCPNPIVENTTRAAAVEAYRRIPRNG